MGETNVQGKKQIAWTQFWVNMGVGWHEVWVTILLVFLVPNAHRTKLRVIFAIALRCLWDSFEAAFA